MRNLKLVAITLLAICSLMSCSDYPVQQAESDSGVTKASVKVKTDVNGHSVEQSNYIERVTRDNDLGSLKHLYVISSYSGDVMEYSTVKGKVTSGGKRLSPTSVNSTAGMNSSFANTNSVTINGRDYYTDEVMDEYGMYGSSMPYVYWFDAQGNYHQYFPSGGTYLHISDRPLRVRKSNLSVEIEQK
jgi:hypothetical protein